MPTDQPPATKAERTREALVETALRLFRERGYEATTMRLIATEAGVSQGNAYYYFDGKDAFVQELYRRIQIEHRALAAPQLIDGAPLAENLRTVLRTGIETIAPYHSFGSTMLHVAIKPNSPVSPFSPDSHTPREQAVGLMSLAVSASKGVPSGAFGARLPQLLWSAYLAVVLFWVTDTSPEQFRTYALADGVAPLIGKAVSLARLPVGRSLASDVVHLFDKVTS